MAISRRGFIAGVAAALAAPAVIRVADLMPARAPELIVPRLLAWGDSYLVGNAGISYSQASVASLLLPSDVIVHSDGNPNGPSWLRQAALEVFDLKSGKFWTLASRQ